MLPTSKLFIKYSYFFNTYFAGLCSVNILTLAPKRLSLKFNKKSSSFVTQKQHNIGAGE